MVAKFGDRQNNDYHEWVEKNAGGYVWNVGHRRLHRASCRHARSRVVVDQKNPPPVKLSASKFTKKVCAMGKRELCDEVPAAGDPKNGCGVCCP